MIAPNWQPVDGSSQLTGFGYDQSSCALTVQFHGGAVYDYAGVPRLVYDGLCGSKSKGSYFIAFVKKAGYAYAKRP